MNCVGGECTSKFTVVSEFLYTCTIVPEFSYMPPVYFLGGGGIELTENYPRWKTQFVGLDSYQQMQASLNRLVECKFMQLRLTAVLIITMNSQSLDRLYLSLSSDRQLTATLCLLDGREGAVTENIISKTLSTKAVKL